MDASAVIDSMRIVKTVLNLTMLHLAATHGERLSIKSVASNWEALWAIKTFARVAFYHPKLPILDGCFKIANWVRFASSFKVASCSLTFLVTCPI